MTFHEQYLDFTLWGNTGTEYAIALGAFLITFIVTKLFKFVIIHRLRAFAQKTETKLDDLVISILDTFHWQFFTYLSLIVGVHFLHLSPGLNKALDYILVIFLTYYAIKAISQIIDFAGEEMIKKKGEAYAGSPISALSKLAKVFLWFIGLIFLISNLGYDITSIVTGLGIGGIAVALALQNILGDIFSSFSIYFDEPFKVGDNINFGLNRGKVKRIGIKSTRIQTLEGEELVVSNRELTNLQIRNYVNMEERRVLFTLSVVYDTTPTKLKWIPFMIEEIIKKTPNTRFDRAHFAKFSESSLDFEVVYFVLSPDYSVLVQAQQQVNLAIKEKFDSEKVVFAYPTRTLYTVKE